MVAKLRRPYVSIRWGNTCCEGVSFVIQLVHVALDGSAIYRRWRRFLAGLCLSLNPADRARVA